MTPDRIDPRQTEQAAGRDVRPIVASPAKGNPLGVIIAIALVAGLLLFMALNARRQALSAPATMRSSVDRPAVAPPPPLYVPPSLSDVAPSPQPSLQENLPQMAAAPAPLSVPQRQVQPTFVPTTVPQPGQVPVAPRNASGPALVIDTSQAALASQPPPGPRPFVNPLGAPSQTGTTTDRARAGMFANRATTVPQGTLIPAVLETGFDSTRPGFARALIQRDIRGFDGSQVLIPRGSRLIGEYGADTTSGQNRAGILWSRLIRPDGMTIEIASPAADTVGRGGVRAKVNSHFWERFGSAILQSSLDIGVNLASRAGNGSVVVLPGGSQALTGRFVQPNNVRPTLSVRPGTSVSVFVARDLDFTAARGDQ